MDTGSTSYESLFGARRMTERLLKGSPSTDVDSTLDNAHLGARSLMSRLLLDSLGSAVVDGSQSVFRDVESA